MQFKLLGFPVRVDAFFLIVIVALGYRPGEPFGPS